MEETNQNLITRPPVVVILGHVDSGKTSILDYIRQTRVAEKESGGITQHVGAYEIEQDGKKITFIDTPGHEAFSAMRSRGAKVADIAVLVVDATEGVQPQTKEAILHIKKSEVESIVAINKIDRPEADPERTKRELAREDVLVESTGGKIPSVNVSAKTGKGIPELLEMILLVAEMRPLKADISKPAEGVIVEAHLDSQRGSTATLLIKDGILKIGDVVGTESCFGKVKNLLNFQGIPTEKGLPSMPVMVFGLEGMPKVGEEFRLFPTIELARSGLQPLEKRPLPAMVPEQLELRVLNMIIKADFLGSIEAIAEILKDIPQEKVALRVLKFEVGDINESDIKMVKGTGGKILGFRVKTSSIIREVAERENIRIINCEVIYELVEAVRKLMEKALGPEVVRVDLGKIKVLIVFLTEKNRQIVGGKVIEGEIKKGVSLEVFRNEENVGAGRIINLQKNKKEVDRVLKGDECGILYEGNTRINEGDVLAIYTEERRKGEL